MQRGTIARWEKKEGDKIGEGELIAEVSWEHRLCCISNELHVHPGFSLEHRSWVKDHRSQQMLLGTSLSKLVAAFPLSEQ